MGFLLRAAAIAAIGTTAGLAPDAGFGQAGEVAPPAQGTAPAPGDGDPAGPDGPAIILPAPPGVLPRIESAPTIRGADCEHERAPGTGV
jgi:hypothetical protein